MTKRGVSCPSRRSSERVKSEAQGSGDGCRKTDPFADLEPGDRAILPGQAIGLTFPNPKPSSFGVGVKLW